MSIHCIGSLLHAVKSTSKFYEILLILSCFHKYIVGGLLVVILFISSCISSTKFQGAAISLGVVYFLSQIVFAAVDLYCDQYHNQGKIERLRDDLNKKGQIQAMVFRITANMLIFCEICQKS